MKIYVRNGNVLDGEEHALCLTIDGAGPGMEGNVARQFARRWPLLWQELSQEIRFPLPLGRVFVFEVPDEYEDCPFRLILLASTLHHQQVMDPVGKRSVVSAALAGSIKLLSRYRINSLACTMMRGGWRMTQDEAIMAMNAAINATAHEAVDMTLSIYVLDSAEYQYSNSLARTLGWHA